MTFKRPAQCQSFLKPAYSDQRQPVQHKACPAGKAELPFLQKLLSMSILLLQASYVVQKRLGAESMGPSVPQAGKHSMQEKKAHRCAA